MVSSNSCREYIDGFRSLNLTAIHEHSIIDKKQLEMEFHCKSDPIRIMHRNQHTLCFHNRRKRPAKYFQPDTVKIL